MVTVNDLLDNSFLNWYYRDIVPDKETVCSLVRAIYESPDDFEITVDDVIEKYSGMVSKDVELFNFTFAGWLLGL